MNVLSDMSSWFDDAVDDVSLLLRVQKSNGRTVHKENSEKGQAWGQTR